MVGMLKIGRTSTALLTKYKQVSILIAYMFRRVV